uniref:PH domain-containing protein n=1 Tax=Macrostomum lignano TaxID=282301 RepID=A0A1I8JAB7_9PLAT
MSPAGPQQQQPPQSQQAPQPLPMGPSTEVRGLHQSLMPGLPVGSASFAISNNPDRVNRYFAAQSQEEARRWQDGLRKVSRPDLENTRHRENSLKLWIFEAKRLQSKKSYFCEISLNQVLYARTSNKEKTSDSDPFWGEAFEFSAASSAPAAIRVKARYLSVDVLPLAWYSGLHDCLLRDHCLLAACLEPRLHVRVKEDLASC